MATWFLCDECDKCAHFLCHSDTPEDIADSDWTFTKSGVLVWTKAKVCKRCPTSKCVDETLQLLIPPQATGEQHRNNPYDIQWVRNSFTYDSWQAWHLKPKLPVHQLFFLIILLVGCRQGAGTDVRIIAHPFSVTAKFGRARLQDELSNYVKALSGAGVAQRISSALELIEHAFARMLAGWATHTISRAMRKQNHWHHKRSPTLVQRNTRIYQMQNYMQLQWLQCCFYRRCCRRLVWSGSKSVEALSCLECGLLIQELMVESVG